MNVCPDDPPQQAADLCNILLGSVQVRFQNAWRKTRTCSQRLMVFGGDIVMTRRRISSESEQKLGMLYLEEGWQVINRRITLLLQGHSGGVNYLKSHAKSCEVTKSRDLL